MKESFWGYFIILMGIFSIAIVLLFQDITNTDDQNYYLVKEITEAAMIDAIDPAHWEVYGQVAIDKEKFVENFVRRFAQSAGYAKTYDIDIYEVIEMPPKVSLRVGAKSTIFSFTGEDFDIINRMDAILETKTIN